MSRYVIGIEVEGGKDGAPSVRCWYVRDTKRDKVLAEFDTLDAAQQVQADEEYYDGKEGGRP